MTVSSLGTGSGLDLSGLLTNLMQAEQQPVVALQKKEASYQARISSLGTLKGVLSSLQTAAQTFIPSSSQTASTKYSSYSANVADSTIASASATTGAVAGSYSLEVNALAQSHRLTSLDSSHPTEKAAMAAGLLTGGTLKIDLGTLAETTTGSGVYAYTADASRQLNVTIAAGSTLEQMRDAINAAATDGRVSATIVTGTNGQQLVLSSSKTGTANAMQLSGIEGFDFAFSAAGAGSGALSQASENGGQAASNAAYKLNGIAGTSSTNTVTGALDGVTLTLSKLSATTTTTTPPITTTTTPTTLTVTRDNTSALTSAISSFVKAFNEAAKSMRELGAYNASTKVAGALQGDSTLRGAQSQVSALLQTRAGGTSVYQTLSNIGVSLEKDGTLKLNTTKLNAAVAADYAGVTDLVANLGSSFKSGLETLVGASGNITAATNSANRIIKDIGTRYTVLSARLTQIEARYRKQFTDLDTLVAGMKSTSTYLTQQLANLPGAANTSSN